MLDKGGFRRGRRGIRSERLKQKIQFVNELVGRNTDNHISPLGSTTTVVQVSMCRSTWTFFIAHIFLRICNCCQKQKQVSIPYRLHDIWDGPKRITVGTALQAASIKPGEFDTRWAARVQSANETEDGKKKFLQLLEKGGFRYSNQRVDSSTRWRQKIWFVNAVVGRAMCEPVLGSPKGCTRTNVCEHIMSALPVFDTTNSHQSPNNTRTNTHIY